MIFYTRLQINFKNASGLFQKFNPHSHQKIFPHSHTPPSFNRTTYEMTQSKWDLDKHKNLVTTVTVSHAVTT